VNQSQNAVDRVQSAEGSFWLQSTWQGTGCSILCKQKLRDYAADLSCTMQPRVQMVLGDPLLLDVSQKI
jgi:hypothetical protein